MLVALKLKVLYIDPSQPQQHWAEALRGAVVLAYHANPLIINLNLYPRTMPTPSRM